MTDDPRHRPVLADEAVAALAPRDGGTYVDATFGAGGYARRILGVAGTRVVGIDRDPNAVRDAAPLLAAYPERLTLDHARFATLDDVCARHGIAQVDGVVMDVGVSSMQLDDAMRGFSFRFDGPLDMRMSGEGPSAADVVARASEKTLADVIYLFGEERQSRRIARAIATDRAKEPLDTTRKLAELIGRVVRSKPHEIHPATRTFQALRILVNGELDELQAGLEAAERVLKPGGRLAVVSFHSLEDRIVKTFFAARAETSAGSRHLPDVARSPARFVTLARKPVTAGDDELRDNPRARSAKLRSAERTAEPSIHDDDAPSWPDIHDVLRGG